VGGGTKLAWAPCEADVELSTAGLDRIVEHNAGDLTALLQAGVPLAHAQEAFAAAGQMFALDPPDGAATIGGVVATGDSGPLRHRYGAVRDLLIGATVALSDGTIARSGGKVIKNVAGYDLAKLVAGSFGTLGVILEVAVRLHPIPRSRATAVFETDDPDELGRRVLELSHAPLELEALDVRWQGGQGAVLARFAGARAAERASSVDGALVDEDEVLWAGQRAAQVDALRVSVLQTDWPRLLRVTQVAGGSLVGRAGLGLAWISGADESAVRAEFPERTVSGATLELMRRVRARFDPAGVLNPGVLVS
jgi:glycolate dehydrogenase FAD-binding subunit